MNEDIISFPYPSDDRSPLVLEMTGISYCDGTYRISREKSRTSVFEYVLKGSGELIVDSIKYEPCAGDVYIVRSGTKHSYWSSTDDPWTKIWFNVHGPLVANLLTSYSLDNIALVKDCPLCELFHEGFEKAKGRPRDINEEISLVLHRIIQAVSVLVRTRHENIRSEEGLKLKTFIDDNMEKDISLGHMARFIAKSPSQTVRIFRKDWGKTPYDYLLEKRIQRAKSLLGGTVANIKEISHRSGFKDQYYFSSIFKLKVGVSPEKFRKTI